MLFPLQHLSFGLRKTLVTRLSSFFWNTPDCTQYLIFQKQHSGGVPYAPNSAPTHMVLHLVPFSLLFLHLGHFHRQLPPLIFLWLGGNSHQVFTVFALPLPPNLCLNYMPFLHSCYNLVLKVRKQQQCPRINWKLVFHCIRAFNYCSNESIEEMGKQFSKRRRKMDSNRPAYTVRSPRKNTNASGKIYFNQS